MMRSLLFLSVVCLTIGAARADNLVQRLLIPGSEEPGQLAIDAQYYLWTPPLARKIRSVIIHQHSCGQAAEQAGQTAAFDLHWQLLASKWDSALLGVSYAAEGKACALWSDPQQGSADALLSALQQFAKRTGHPELEVVPWTLWGHAGGASWAYRMFERHPERCVAVCMRSGKPTDFTPGTREIGNPLPINDAKRDTPILCCIGLKEKDDPVAISSFRAHLRFFNAWRPAGALITLTLDPLTNTECGNSRYLMIPYIDACLQQRLPALHEDAVKLRSMSSSNSWLGNLDTGEVTPAGEITDPKRHAWLPTANVAQLWNEFVRNGQLLDSTPPTSSPKIFSAFAINPTSVQLAWQAEPDFDSGLLGFRIERDGEFLADVRSQGKAVGTLPQFQQLTEHDTPTPELPLMKFIDEKPVPGKAHQYRVIALNGYELPSLPSGNVTALPARVRSFNEPIVASTPDAAIPDALRSQLDVTFSKSSAKELKLDLFAPKSATQPLPAIVVIHGGGWANGDRTKVRSLAMRLAERGFVTAAVSYRLSGDAVFPAAIQDVSSAVRFLRAEARTLGVDPNWVGAVGVSTGGHLAGLLATGGQLPTFTQEGQHLEQSGQIQACAILGGPVDLTAPEIVLKSNDPNDPGMTGRFLGKSAAADPELYWLASPIAHVSRLTPPILFLDGELDEPGKRYTDMRMVLDSFGIRHNFEILGKGKPGSWSADPWQAAAVDAIDRFFRPAFSMVPAAAADIAPRDIFGEDLMH